MEANEIELEGTGADLAECVRRAKQGKEVVITEHGQPVARIVAIGATPQRRFGSAKGLVHLADDFDAPLGDFADYA